MKEEEKLYHVVHLVHSDKPRSKFELHLLAKTGIHTRIAE